ncbi:MAG: fibronectin type III domain-containing protein [Thermoflexaceae bacterium]|nr:fibronectin type III domain-containing protein [Thermoflexaceae bacterium]
MRLRRNKRFMSGLLTVLLTISLLPTEFMNGKLSVQAENENGSETTVITFNASELPEGDITQDLVFGDFTLGASSDKKLTVDANAKSNEDGTMSFTKRLKYNGKSGETERTVSFTTGGAGTAAVYMISSNKEEADRSLSLYDTATGEMVEGGTYFAPTSAGDDGKITPVVYNIPQAGTYCFKASQGINIYYIKVEYTGNTVQSITRKDWDEVEAPVINSVTVNDEGTIDVDVSMAIGTDGADSARLFLFQNGYENMCVQITESGVYNFAPSLKGDYVVKAEAYRKGCPDKESEEVKIKNYKLPLANPEITWLNNLGDGSVYVDWNNVDADGFEVAYRESGTEKYTVAASNLTEGDYTLTGLTEGKPYEIKVTAYKEDEKKESTGIITVGEPKQQWYIAAMGSATSGTITVNGKEYAVKTDSGIIPVEDVTGTDGTIEIASQTNGKIADSEDGIFYYFTKVDPNTENFVLTATYMVTNVNDGPDNQTGYGIYATDIAGVGSKDAKYFNSVSVGQFKMYNNGYHGHGARLITGYTSYDAYNNQGAIRNHDNKNSFSVVNENDSVKVGDTFTYTLEKTDEGYIASMDGANETITFNGTESIMVQEDGSICVGVASARKVGVEISNITFQKTEGIAGGDNEILVEPDFSIYSGNTTGSTEYELIVSANVAGFLKVRDSAGNEIYNGELDADKIIRADAVLTVGAEETFTYEFTPDNNVENLKSYETISGEHKVLVRQIGKPGDILYVTPDGKTDGDGSLQNPLDLQTILNYAQPGQTIVLLNGKYKLTQDLLIGRSVNGTKEQPIILMAQSTGGVLLDGSGLENSVSMLSIVGSSWHVYGLELAYGSGKGISVCGNDNIVEMCNIHNMSSAGLQISRYSAEPNDDGMWPENNLIKNCDAHDCCDKGRTDADGFAAKLTCGTGNKFYGCIAHHNIDDGWDLYAKSTTGPIGEVVIENCVSYSNGFLREDNLEDETMLFGEGNGFKLGGENMFGAHQLINCVSYNNFGKGITSNSGPNCEIISCTAYNNSLNGKAYNVSLYTKNSNPKAWILTGMLSVVDNATTNPELGAGNGVIYSLRSSTNYLYDGLESTNNEGVAATTDWFESTDIAVEPTRNADGTINMHGVLVLNSSAPANTGARIDTGKNAASIQPVAISADIVAADNTVEPESRGMSPIIPIVAVAGILLAIILVIWKKITG